MARQSVMVLTCFLVAAMLNSAIGLKCYNCMKCNDPFNKDGQTATDCSGVCMKEKASTDLPGYQKGDVARGCLPEKTEIKCEEREIEGYKGEVCYCDTDECNGSGINKFTIATGIIATVTILKNMNFF